MMIFILSENKNANILGTLEKKSTHTFLYFLLVS